MLTKVTSSPPGRMAVLRREIASLPTSLPDGILVKISESRPDVMKVLIQGFDGLRMRVDCFRELLPPINAKDCEIICWK